MQKNKEWYIKGLIQTFHLMGAAYFKLISFSLLIFIIMGLFYSLLDTSLSWFFIDIVSWNLPFKGMAARNMLNGMMLFTSLTLLFALYPLLLFGIGLYAFSQIEVKNETHLIQQINEIGRQKEIKGIAIE